MSGEFGQRMRALMDRKYSTVAEASFLNYFRDEILSLYEAAHNQRNHGSGLPCDEVQGLYLALDALDDKAKEKL